MVFDSSSPRCSAHPTAEEQYGYEWTFANLDTDGNKELCQHEMEALRRAVPEVAGYVPGGDGKLSLLSFVDVMRR